MRNLAMFILAAFVFGTTTLSAADPATAPAAARVQFRLVATDDDAAAEVVPVADPENDERELRLAREVVLDGAHVASATVVRDSHQAEWSVMVEFTEDGSRRLEDATGSNIDRRLALVVDGKVVTAPTIRSRVSRSARITGRFDKRRADELAAAINTATARTQTTQPAR